MKNGSGATELYDRLLARKDEIEQAILTRVYGISDPTEVGDPTYLEGLREAVSAAIDFGLVGLDRSERHSEPVPALLLSQARLAARNGVGLDTVLRRYFGGYALLSDFMVEEATKGSLSQGAALKDALRVQAGSLDRLLAVVSEEHRCEERGAGETIDCRRLNQVRRLLAGELLDTADLAYDFTATHLGLVARGPNAAGFCRELANALDRRPLLVHPDDETVWAWFESRRKIDREELRRLISSLAPPRGTLAFGEPSDGSIGWRLSHRQASAALTVALRRRERCAFYSEVALLASALQDDLLVTSLQALFLKPLEVGRDGGLVLFETLAAYLDSERNVSSAAVTLRVKRHTVTSRLRTIEALLERPLGSCLPELEVALMLKDGRKQAGNSAALAGRPPRQNRDSQPSRDFRGS